MAGKCWTDRHRFWIAKQTLSYTRTRWFSGSRRDRLEISHPGSERQAGKGRGRESGLSLMRERSLHSLRLSLLNAIVTLLQNVPLSVTGAHFRDAPRGLENFKYIETLYDASTMSGKLLLPFEARNYLSYASYKDSLAFVYPDAPVSPEVFFRPLWIAQCGIAKCLGEAKHGNGSSNTRSNLWFGGARFARSFTISIQASAGAKQ